MMKLAPAVLVALLGLSTFGCAAPATDATSSDDVVTAASTTRSVEASRDAEHGMLGALWAVHGVESDDADIRLYELSGGDPAANGTSVLLSIDAGYGDAAIWDLGVNIRTITKATSGGPGVLALEGLQDTYDDETGGFELVPFEASIVYGFGAEGLEPTIAITSGGETHTASADDGAAARFLGSVYAMHTAEQDDVVARVFEAGGGDPAMNGDHLFLTLSAYPEEQTFDLGLNVATVSSMAFSGPNELRIDGFEDTMNEEGEISAAPFAYVVTFTVEDYAPAPRITVRRAR